MAQKAAIEGIGNMAGYAGVFLSVDRDGLTNGIQLSIEQRDAKNSGTGYRFAGPKYSGCGTNLLRHRLNARDIAELRRHLEKAEAMLAQQDS